MDTKYKNILVYALVNLGDVILSTSAIALLRRAYPEAKITMMVKPVAKEIVENNPLIDEVIIFGYEAKKSSWSKMMDLVKNIRQRQFNLALSFDRKLRPAFLCWLAGIPVRVGPSKVFDEKASRVTWLYTHTVPINHDLNQTHQAETYQAIVQGFTGVVETARPVFAKFGEKEENKVSHLFQGFSAEKKKIALCVKGTFALKNWPQDYFASLIDELSKTIDAELFIIGAPEDKEYAGQVIAKTAVKAHNFCGKTSLKELACLFAKSDLFVTVDTGACHVAATTGVPMVVLYGCTTPKRWKPVSDHVKVLSLHEHLACCPCNKAEEDCPDVVCLRKITVTDVLERCQQLLQQKGE